MKYCPKCQQQYATTQRFCLADGQLLSLPDPYYLVERTLMEKYRIEALVGIGGMGAVYSARHLMLNRQVAFKILLPNLALGNEKMLNLFQREAETVGQLNHENIVDVKDAGRTPNGLAYIVMEWIEGHTLDDEIAQGLPLGFERIAEILRQVAAALDHAHAHRIVHCDLKPSNIMLVRRADGREQVKVVDFGIAKVISETTASPVSRIMGTPHYASPEQFSVGAHLDGRADIYSLGVMLYQMLTAHLPFSATTPHEIARLHKTEPPPSPRLYRQDVPLAIEQLVLRMLAKDPQHRPPTAMAAAELFLHVIGLHGSAITLPALGVTTGKAAPAVTNERLIAEPVSADPLAPTVRVETDGTTDLSRVNTAPGLAQPSAVGLQEPARPEPPPPEVEPARQPPVETGNSRARRWRLLGAALLLLAVVWFFRYLKPAWWEPAKEGARVELMSYYLEVSSDQCETTRRTTGDEPLRAGQSFRFHFIPRERGYLYIIAADRNNVPTAFLTAQPDPGTGVTTNFIEAGADFSFPAGNCLGITEAERMMAFTVIFSPSLLPTPSFLAAPAMRPLIASEQHELASWRQQFTAGAVEVAPDFSRQLSRVTRLQPGSHEAGRPVVVDLPVKSH